MKACLDARLPRDKLREGSARQGAAVLVWHTCLLGAFEIRLTACTMHAWHGHAAGHLNSMELQLASARDSDDGVYHVRALECISVAGLSPGHARQRCLRRCTVGRCRVTGSKADGCGEPACACLDQPDWLAPTGTLCKRCQQSMALGPAILAGHHCQSIYETSLNRVQHLAVFVQRDELSSL